MGDPVLAQLHIKVGIGEAGRAPMFLDDDIAGLGAKARIPFTAPAIDSEQLVLVRRTL